MNAQDIAAIILAAGKGTRMKSARHKVLHEIGGRPMLGHVLANLEALGVSRHVVVLGAERDQVEAKFPGLNVAVQEPQLGTGHAVLAARAALGEPAAVVLILYADVPLISADTMQRMANALIEGPEKRAIAVLGFRPDDPGAYGRLIVGRDNRLLSIVEFKDATSSERAVRLCNSGIMAVRGEHLFSLLVAVDNDNAAGEYYLTDIVKLATDRDLEAIVVEGSADEVSGVNSRVELAEAEAAFQAQARHAAMIAGATLIDPESVHFSADTVLGSDVIVEPNVFFGPEVVVGDGVTIKGFSHLEGCTIASGATVGPFARLRPGAQIGPEAKVGNFVEIKQAEIERGAKVSHLSYIGDATVGEGANIGAGTITCNYDGFFKYRTTIGADAFIGSNSALVAPVTVGEGAIVGAGSVVTKDVEAGDLAVARGAQSTRKGWAKRFRKMMAKRKADKKGSR